MATLCCWPKERASAFCGSPFGNAERFAHFPDLFGGKSRRKLCFELNVLPGAQLRKKAQVLEYNGQSLPAKLQPLLGAQLPGFLVENPQIAGIVGSEAVDQVEQGRLSLARGSGDQVIASSFKAAAGIPDFRSREKPIPLERNGLNFV